MILRKLELEDAPLMLEWMHDESIVEKMNNDFMSMTSTDCKRFIKRSWDDANNVHLAIDECGEYLGTVSLKNIENERAEFAIAERKKTMGTGVAAEAMREIIRIGFEDMGLNEIYWYVNTDNTRALRFYDKNGYERIMKPQYVVDESDKEYVWYRIYHFG